MLETTWRDTTCTGKECPAVLTDPDRTFVVGKTTDTPGTVRIPATANPPDQLLAAIGATTGPDGDHHVTGTPADHTSLDPDTLDQLAIGRDETAVIL